MQFYNMLWQYVNMSLKEIVEDSDTAFGKAFDLSIQFLIIVSIISFTFETLPDLSPTTIAILNYINAFSLIVFTVEYILRISVADKKLKFIFSFYGLIDLFAILPFYVSTGVDLRSIRIIRLLRLFRLFKLVRYNQAIRRFGLAFKSIKAELVLFFVATVFLLYISSVGIYYFESDAQPDQFSSIFHCFWWSVATLTTVGYGDVYPITLGGRIFTGIVILVGIGIVAVPTGLIALALTNTVKSVE